MDQLQLSAPPAPADLPWKRTRIRVPRHDGGLLAIPDFSSVPGTVAANQDLLDSTECDIFGQSLQTLRKDARAEAVLRASRLSNVDVPDDGPLIVTGHQPELFHPGVWVKQFAVTEIARRSTGIGLNLIVDSDMMHSREMRVPIGTRDQPTTVSIPFDCGTHTGPWQDVRIHDQRCFAEFENRVSEALKCWGYQPLINELWPHAVAHAKSGAGLAECLSVARMRMESDWGEGNLELPLSELCGTTTFQMFAVDLLSRADEFRQTYNRVLNEFRSINRIRSESHPVPELAESQGWIEAPFMVWHAGDGRRRHVFVRQTPEEIQLARGPDEAELFARLPFGNDHDPSDAVAELSRLEASGCRFRTRALTTTMFTRLFLADLFVHGIGGAKYDEMTDHIVADFYGILPPEFLTLSATAWLPLADAYSETSADIARVNSMQRELQHNPQRFVSRGVSDRIDQLLDEKQRLILEQQQSEQQQRASETRPQAWTGLKRYRRIPEINRELAVHTAKQQRDLRDELLVIERRLEANTVLTGREYSFCLYPTERMQRMIAQTHAAFDA